MKKMMSIAAIALMVVGSSAFACDTCGCKDKKAEAKAACATCPVAKACDKCTSTKTCDACTVQKAAAAKAAAEKAAAEKSE